jgi:hypothetical protein
MFKCLVDIDSHRNNQNRNLLDFLMYNFTKERLYPEANSCLVTHCGTRMSMPFTSLCSETFELILHSYNPLA